MKSINSAPSNLVTTILTIAVFALIVASLMALDGCSTTSSTTVTPTTNSLGQVTYVTNTTSTTGVNTNIANFAKSLIATNGIVTDIALSVVTAETTKLVSQAIASDPASKTYFQSAQTALALLISGGNVSSAALTAAIAKIPVTGPAASIIQQGIASLLGAYQQAEAVTVSQKINAVPYLGAFLSTVNAGITAGL